MIRLESDLRALIDKVILKMAGERDMPYEFGLTKDEKHGDLTTNAAMVIASRLKKNPREVVKEILNVLKLPKNIEKAEIAGPGFINFRISAEWFRNTLREIDKKGKKYGSVELGKGKKVQIEFLSANPTGPLHIGHGRVAVYGDTLASLLEFSGYKARKEYYINDAGVQMRTLGLSVYTRMQQQNGQNVTFPENGYQGAYISDIAKDLQKKEPDLLRIPQEKAIGKCTKYAADRILNEIKEDLKELGVKFDLYFSESVLHEKKKIDKVIKRLRDNGHLYENDNALWFRSTAFGDDKDRVLVKRDGNYTYITADIAYHDDKFKRGFDRVIDIWGADHAGYVSRMKASIEAIGYDPKRLDVVLIQLVNLVSGGNVVSMSTRSATYETLEDVRKDVGRDVCRYFFLMRSHNAQLDFDLELAHKQTPENPVFYIQYAHARIASVFKKAEAVGIKPKNKHLELLTLPEEVSLMRNMSLFPRTIRDAAIELEPHRIAYYLLDLSRQFQSYYSKARTDDRYKFISNDEIMTSAKLYLLKNIKQVLLNGLVLLGISAPSEMRGELIN